MTKNHQQSWHDFYEKIEIIGRGGNAKVFRVRQRSTGKKFALKELQYNKKNTKKRTDKKTEEKKYRFKDEITIMEQNYKHINGIIPILDSSKKDFWYTMPIAVPALEHIKNSKQSIEDILKGIIQLSDTLSKLHSIGLSHRDIKPANIYYYNNRFYLGDFGLVDFPDNPNDFTRSDKGLGAIFTIAPEMKRDPKNADGKKADVFSLAKTTWMVLSEDERGFDGVYNFEDSSHSLRYINKFKGVHLVELEELLISATSNSPDLRPDINSFKQQLQYYLSVLSDYDRSQISDWKFINKYLFGVNPAESTTWRNIDKIINVLNVISTLPAYNHMLFSDKGGLDFNMAERANERGCIYIYDSIGSCHLVKPKCLHYESFNDNYSWNYFLLELDELSPIINETSLNNEMLVEDYPGHYTSAQYAQYGVYDYDLGNPLPDGYKIVYRYLAGKFLIVLKRGPYNQIPATYDGRHGLCSNNDFRKYIDMLIQLVEKAKTHGYSQENILKSNFCAKNPFVQQEDIIETIGANKYPDTFINNNYDKWCFKDFFTISQNRNNIKFRFVFTSESESSINITTDFFSKKKLYLCSDGHIKLAEPSASSEVYYVYNRNDALKLYKDCTEYIQKKCQDNRFEAPITSNFTIELQKNGKPIHLFEKDEIRTAMREADDRFHNQLVVDENGYAKVICDEGFGDTYPVSHECFNAGNIYVGKYSTLSTLDDDYISSLQGWLIYLKTGEHERMDYVHENMDEEELIKEIKKFY